MRGYWTKQRMSCFSDLPRTALCGGRALVRTFFSLHFSHLALFSFLLSFFPTATTLVLIQLDKLKSEPQFIMCMILGSRWMTHQKSCWLWMCFSMLSTAIPGLLLRLCTRKTKIDCSRQKGAYVFLLLSFSLCLSTTTTHTQSHPIHNFPASLIES